MMNVKETLKRLHKKFPMMGLDELFDVLDCYVEEVGLSGTISTWKPSWEPDKIWYSNAIDCSKTNGIEKAINKIDASEAKIVPAIYNTAEKGVVELNGNKYYDGSTSVTAKAVDYQFTGPN